MPHRFGGSDARTPPSLRIAPPALVIAAVTSLMPRTITCSRTEPGSCRRVCNGVALHALELGELEQLAGAGRCGGGPAHFAADAAERANERIDGKPRRRASRRSRVRCDTPPSVLSRSATVIAEPPADDAPSAGAEAGSDASWRSSTGRPCGSSTRTDRATVAHWNWPAAWRAEPGHRRPSGARAAASTSRTSSTIVTCPGSCTARARGAPIDVVELDRLDPHRRARNARVHMPLGGPGGAEHLVETGIDHERPRSAAAVRAEPAGAAVVS